MDSRHEIDIPRLMERLDNYLRPGLALHADASTVGILMQILRDCRKALATERQRAEAAEARAERLAKALTAIGVMPDGFCVCFGNGRDPMKPEHQHTGECQDARAALQSEEK